MPSTALFARTTHTSRAATSNQQLAICSWLLAFVMIMFISGAGPGAKEDQGIADPRAEEDQGLADLRG